MSSGKTILWVSLGILGLLLLTAGAAYCPRIIREGRQIVGPVIDLARSEKAIESLAEELPYRPPADGLVREERLLAFLEVRRELLPHYRRWQETRRELERSGEESLDDAREILSLTRDVFRAQIDVLRAAKMSPLEFRWLETAVYDEWLEALETPESGEGPEVARRLKELAGEDLRYIEELARRHGRSRGLREMEARLRDRLARLEAAESAPVPGVPVENDRLFREHHEAITALDLAGHRALHKRLSREDSGDIDIDLD